MLVRVLCYQEHEDKMTLKGGLIFDLKDEKQKKRYIKELTEFTTSEAYQIERYEEKNNGI